MVNFFHGGPRLIASSNDGELRIVSDLSDEPEVDIIKRPKKLLVNENFVRN